MSNTKKNYKKGTRHKIVKMVLMCGCIPWEALNVIDGNPEVYKMKIREMVKEGVLDVVRVLNNRRTYRLVNFNDFDKNLKEFQGYYSIDELNNYIKNGYEDNKRAKYIKNTDKGTDSLRVILSNEITILMMTAGILTTPDEKNDICIEMTEDSNKSSYYTSREIRKQTGYTADVTTDTTKKYLERSNTDTDKRISNSRASGILMSPGNVYVVYNISHIFKNWYRSAEYKMQIYVNRLLYEKGIYNMSADSAILFAKNYDAFLSLVWPEDSMKDHYENIKYTFKYIYALPYSPEGREMVKIMKVKGWRHRLKQHFIGKFNNDTNGIAVDCDAYMDDTYVCAFLAPELSRYKRFLAWAEEGNNRDKYIVVCFDFQLDFVRRTAGRYCKIMKADFWKYIKETKVKDIDEQY